jgi:hypothetical protein
MEPPGIYSGPVVLEVGYGIVDTSTNATVALPIAMTMPHLRMQRRRRRHVHTRSYLKPHKGPSKR